MFFVFVLVGCKEESVPAAPSRYPFQVERWNKAELNGKDLIRLDKEVARFNQNKDRYVKIEKMRPNGVPAPVIYCLHVRESGADFTKHLHNGNPLTKRTYDVPSGRPKTGSPPFDFFESAEDALYILKGYEKKDWSELSSVLDTIERWNGLGYRKFNIPSPFLWNWTSIAKPGKYVADGVWSSTAIDKQPGCAAILKRMNERGVKLSFLSEGGKNSETLKTIRSFFKKIWE